MDPCPDGYYESSGECLKCYIQCLTCLETLKCTACAPRYFKNAIGGVSNYFNCIDTCPTGKYLKNGECINCPNLCSKCVSDTHCIDCVTNAYLYVHSSTSLCYDPCPIGTYLSGYVCKDCSIECASCASFGNDNCISCAPRYYGYYRLDNGG